MRDTGDKKASLYARGFVKKLEEMLSNPTDAPRLVADPNPAVNGQVVISGVVPPRALYPTASIPVCVEGPVTDADGKILNTSRLIATYWITTRGEIEPYVFEGEVTTAAEGFAFACRGPLRAERALMLRALGQGDAPP